MNVRIVTDSTSDLTSTEAEQYGITIVPINVLFGDEAFLDNIELDNAAFYRKLQASKALPRTSQPAPAKFQEAYIRLLDEGAEGILSVHLSSKLSGTYQSAHTAADSVADEGKNIPIEVIDSGSISVGMSRAIIHAAEAAKQGADLATLTAMVNDELSRTRILAVLDTLEYVRRGGRIGSAAALLGNALSVKPIISLKNGEVVTIERPRTRSKAFARIAQMVAEMGNVESISIAEADTEVGQQLKQAMKEVYPKEIPTYKLGGVLGTHTGPGTAAIALVTGK